MRDYKAHWERTYRQAYAEGREHWRPGLATPKAFRDFIESRWAPSEGARVLEAGCSDGLNAIGLARQGYSVTGVDVSPTAIARAREVARDLGVTVEFLCLDLVCDSLPGDRAYDLWIDIKTLHCLWQDEDRRRYLANAAACLRRDGVLFLNCGLALRDVREHYPCVFAKLDEETRGGAELLDRDLPPHLRSGIRCETLDWYCTEITQAGMTICEATREASIEGGWGAIIVAKKARD